MLFTPHRVSVFLLIGTLISCGNLIRIQPQVETCKCRYVGLMSGVSEYEPAEGLAELFHTPRHCLPSLLPELQGNIGTCMISGTSSSPLRISQITSGELSISLDASEEGTGFLDVH